MANADTVLVTGGSGFIGLQILRDLLSAGYKVRTSVRATTNQDEIIEIMKCSGISAVDNLSFIHADLTSDKNWKEAVSGCSYVLSVASPVFFGVPKNEAEAMKPAIEGIVRVLKFSRNAGVKRVVMTSSFGALGFSQTDKTRETTEKDWTDPKLRGLSAYEKSKILSERAAWDFIKREGGSLEFCTVNPVAVLGPSLSRHVSGSFDILKHLLDGSMKAVPHIPLNIVDVRDVADIHIRAMTNARANGQRFIATSDGQITMSEMARFIKREMPELTRKVSLRTLPNLIVHLGGIFNAYVRTGSMFLRINRNVSNANARNILGWTPVADKEQAILAAAESMYKYGIVK